MYQLGPSERHRPHHEAKEGLVLPVDDPFWATWYPPNGWGCKCHVRQITKREAEERGISQRPEVPMREVLNPRTGEVKKIPSGIDLGWERNPGMYRRKQMERFLTEKLDGADPVLARVAARDMASSWRLARIHDGSAKGAVPVAMLPNDLAQVLGAKTRVVQFSSDTAKKYYPNPSNKWNPIHPEATADEFVRIAKLLEEGIVAHEITKDGKHNLLFHSKEGKPWRLAVKRTAKGDELYATTFHRSSDEKWQKALEKKNARIIRK